MAIGDLLGGISSNLQGTMAQENAARQRALMHFQQMLRKQEADPELAKFNALIALTGLREEREAAENRFKAQMSLQETLLKRQAAAEEAKTAAETRNAKVAYITSTLAALRAAPPGTLGVATQIAELQRQLGIEIGGEKPLSALPGGPPKPSPETVTPPKGAIPPARGVPEKTSIWNEYIAEGAELEREKAARHIPSGTMMQPPITREEAEAARGKIGAKAPSPTPAQKISALLPSSRGVERNIERPLPQRDLERQIAAIGPKTSVEVSPTPPAPTPARGIPDIVKTLEVGKLPPKPAMPAPKPKEEKPTPSAAAKFGLPVAGFPERGGGKQWEPMPKSVSYVAGVIEAVYRERGLEAAQRAVKQLEEREGKEFAREVVNFLANNFQIAVLPKE